MVIAAECRRCAVLPSIGDYDCPCSLICAAAISRDSTSPTGISYYAILRIATIIPSCGAAVGGLFAVGTNLVRNTVQLVIEGNF